MKGSKLSRGSLGAALVGWCLFAVGCRGAQQVAFSPASAPLTVDMPALYPETLVYEQQGDRFLVGSFRQGAIYSVDQTGKARQLIDDARLCSVLGIAVDSARGRLWAVSSDLGASLKPSSAGPKHFAGVGVYDLSTGKSLAFTDLSALVPGNHLLNGLALDAAGNAYVTDSFAPAIYRLDASGHADVFLQDQAFAGEGINLNGLVVHPDGYLLVIKKSDGTLFKVPLDAPRKFSKVLSDHALIGGDGVLLIGKTELVVVANRTPTTNTDAALRLTSTDAWASAQIAASVPLGDGYPTTATLRGSDIYAVRSKLNQLIQAPPEAKANFAEKAVIERIGRVE